MVLSGRGRDLFTPRRGDPVTVAEASVEVTFQPELVGTTSCTHLNDCLRGLEDVPHLAMQLA